METTSNCAKIFVNTKEHVEQLDNETLLKNASQLLTLQTDLKKRLKTLQRSIKDDISDAKLMHTASSFIETTPPIIGEDDNQVDIIRFNVLYKTYLIKKKLFTYYETELKERQILSMSH